MKLVFFGSPEFALPSLKTLHKSKHQIIAVISQPDKPRGRRQLVTPTPVKDFAVQAGLKVFTPEDLNEERFTQEYKELGADINIVVAYGQIMPVWLIDYPPHKTLNAHTSLLPRYRGAAPIARAIMAGDKETGVTIQNVVEKLDAGDIALQEKVRISEEDNRQSVSVKLANLAAVMLPEALDLKEKAKLPMIKQDEANASYASKINKEEQKINFSEAAQELFNKIRALAPKPGAYVIFNDKRLKIIKASVEEVKGDCGEIIDINKEGILVGTNDKSLLLQTVQPEGGKVMNAYDFAKGQHISMGTRL